MAEMTNAQAALIAAASMLDLGVKDIYSDRTARFWAGVVTSAASPMKGWLDSHEPERTDVAP